ncbi:MAG: ribosome small subunit-dependent GTPase A [Calditrichaeota bacterium]|nr:MAG: ribosome small subunit-dependent GTPase A [Calditrichota bacterium]MBL1206676.1 ribosome small subunit-dependent GTPase A [Calditrichota bacterium]NOG46503.1 ribosome small subunit-dependent GTPase A [Calditrichota bacterium]
MTLEDLGYTKELEAYRKEQNLDSFGIGRVISEHKGRFSVKTDSAEFDAEVIGNMRFTASNRIDLPVVGDWVSIAEYDDNKALIHAIFPRKSIIERKAVGKFGQTQIIASNIDFGIIVQSINRDFNINRLERYLTICNASKIEPIIILSKVDLIDKQQMEELLSQIKERIKNIPIFAISNQTQLGIDELKSKLIKGCTYCLLGSSGVGKSTLINTLTGTIMMDTGEISKSIDRGKHVTSHRELLVLENGILIDNPGMREVGITDSSGGLEITFDKILTFAQDCKFNDCTHTNEKGCAVLAAIENEELDSDSYANYLKMEKEKMHFESNAQERKKKDKDLGKLIKRIKKQKRNIKY